MYVVLIAWIYVTLMMALAEATNSNGTVLGAVITFALYGLLPVSLVVYLMRSPARRKAIREREKAAVPAGDGASLGSGLAQKVSGDPDASGHTAGAAERDTVASVREKP